MEGHKITISENGTVTITGPVQMTFFEIAELFGVFVQTIRSNVKAILKSEVVAADVASGGTMDGNLILPDYYGLDMVTALSFRINSRNAGVFRKWILGKATREMEQETNLQLFISVDNKVGKYCLN